MPARTDTVRPCFRLLVVLGLTLIAAPVLAADDAAPATERCEIPDGLASSRYAFEHVRAARQAKRPVVIIALGTASTAGTAGLSSRTIAYPARLIEWLERRWGPGSVQVVNLAHSGETAAQQLARLPQALAQYHADLLLWQTGTVDALQGVDLDRFGDALEDGIDAAEATATDVLLVDPQYGSQAFALADVDPYLAYLRQIALARGAGLFRRYELMHLWFEAGLLQLRPEDEEAQQRNAAFIHDCLGRALAGMIDEASQ